MSVPVSQMWRVATYVLAKRLQGQKRYPLVLMLEPLFRCNLACAGCGKIQHPADTLARHLSPDQCFRAAQECGAPIISIPGGEPLLHPQIDQIVAGLIEKKKYVYLCTNALKLEESLVKFAPSKYFSFSVHMDGPEKVHDRFVCREGVYRVAFQAIRSAISAGFRVTTNTTLFDGVDPQDIRSFFDEMMELGVEGMMISPGYCYEKAPLQDHFLRRQQTKKLFQRVLFNRPRRWKFNQTPLFLEYLQGRWELECTPWGNPTYNLFGWQKPCYLLDEGYCDTYQELLDSTNWDLYGHQSGNLSCRDCMVHSGHEPTAVMNTFGSLNGLLTTAKMTLLPQGRVSQTEDDNQLPPRPPRNDLVQLRVLP